MGRVWVLALAIVLVTGCALTGCQDKGGQGGTTGKGPRGADKGQRPAAVAGIPTGTGTHRVKIDVGGLVPRDYLIHIPPKLTKGRWRRNGEPAVPLPMVLAMHGGAANAAQMERLSGFSELADDRGFVAVYPEGFLLSWNAGFCCGPAKLTNTDDVGYLKKITDKLVDAGLVDRGRVYATGFSNGAGMAYRLACEVPGKFAAIGVVAAAMAMKTCDPDPISVLVMHGTADQSVPYNGGGRRDFNDSRPFPPVSHAIDYWRKADRLPPLRQTLRSTGRSMNCQTTGRGGGGPEVVLCRIERGPHRWPDGAENELWSFFAAQPPPK